MVSEPHVPPERWHASHWASVQEDCAEISRLRQTNEAMQAAIDRSLEHLREMHAFLQTLERSPVKPAVYVEGHPVCCGVPMWLTRVQISADLRCGHYTCPVCSKEINGVDLSAAPST